MDEITEIKRRAGLGETTNWDPDIVMRATNRMTADLRSVLDQITHLEGDDKGRAEALGIAREMMAQLNQLRKAMRRLRGDPSPSGYGSTHDEGAPGF